MVTPPPMCQRREAFARIPEYYYRGSRQRRVDVISQKFWLLASRAPTNCQQHIVSAPSALTLRRHAARFQEVS